MSAFQQNFDNLYGSLKTTQAIINTIKSVGEPKNNSEDDSSLLRILGVGLIAGAAVWIIYELVKKNKEKVERQESHGPVLRAADRIS